MSSPLPPLGWPYDALIDAALRAERATQAILEAGTAGDVKARAFAELDRETARADYLSVREEIARQWLMGFRAALELQPEAVAALFSRIFECAPPRGPVVDVSSLEESQEGDRPDSIEDAWRSL